MRNSEKSIIVSLIICLICIVAVLGIKSCQDKQKGDNVLKIGAINWFCVRHWTRQ